MVLSYGQTLAALLSAGLILVLALIWQDVLIETFNYFFPDNLSLVAKVVSSIIVTILALIIIVWLDSTYNFEESPILGII